MQQQLPGSPGKTSGSNACARVGYGQHYASRCPVDLLLLQVDHARTAGDLLHLLHVVPEPSTAHTWTGVYMPPDESVVEERQVRLFVTQTCFSNSSQQVAATKDLVRARFLSLLYGSQEVCFQLHIVVGASNTGAVAAAIVEEAELLDAAVVVLGSHLKTLLQELWSGSVTNTVVTTLRKPCVIVR